MLSNEFINNHKTEWENSKKKYEFLDDDIDLYGAVYYTVEMLKYFNDDIKGKTFAISGFGNVAWGTVKKVNELGGKVVTISGPALPP